MVMDAASFRQIQARGAPRLLQHCAAFARITGAEGPSARARLELELGCELADLLVGALASGCRPRATLAAV